MPEKQAAKRVTELEKKLIQGLEGFADALEHDEDITERFTCHKVVLNLEPESYNPALVKKTRKLLGMSQAVFAQFMGVSVQAVQKWEQGRGKPERIACRLMDEFRQNPPYWRNRFRVLAEPKTAKC